MTIPAPIKDFFRNKGGVVRRGELLPALMTARMLQKYMEMGIIQRWGRGFYCLNDKSLPYEPEMLMVARRYPAAVICLVSALSFHDMTTQIPHAVDIAIPYQGMLPGLPIHSCTHSGFVMPFMKRALKHMTCKECL